MAADPSSSAPATGRRSRRHLPWPVWLGAGVVLLVVIAALAWWGSGGSRVSARRQAPPVSAPLLGRAGQLTMAALRGRPAVLDFWASWCPACQAELGDVRRVAETGRASVVGVDVRDQDADAERSLRAAGIHYLNARDPDGRVAAAFAVVGIPTLVVLDPCGQVAATFLGPVTPARVEHSLGRADGCSPAISAAGRPAAGTVGP